MFEIEAQRLVARTGVYSEGRDCQVIPSVKERYVSAKGRINPEGLAVTSAIFTASIPSILPIEASLTTAAHILSNNGSPDLTRSALVGVSLALNAASIAIESRVLRDKDYSASPYGSAFNIMTGKPRLSSALEHAGNHVYLQLTNPINVIAIYNHDDQLLVDSIIATSLTIPAWFIPFNLLIASGRTDSFVNRMKRVRESAVNKIRKKRND